MPNYDFSCPNGHPDYEVRCSIASKADEPHPCPECGVAGKSVILVSPAMPTLIVVDYPGSKKHKAGYIHSHGDRSGTKVQAGYGGKITPSSESAPSQQGAIWKNPLG
jgi:putative FmdB family regulatory protein